MDIKKTQEIQSIANQHSVQHMGISIGVIISYDRFNNVATVAVTENESDQVREILTNVPCPTSPGVQAITPQPGWLACVIFKNGKITNPMIINYYNHRYQMFDYETQTRTPFSVPTHLLD